MTFHFDRVPRWIGLVGAAGTLIWLVTGGPLAAMAFVLGCVASWWNYASLVRVTTVLARAAAEQKSPRMARPLADMFFRLAVLAGGSIAILKFSKASLIPLFIGLFSACIGIALEICYELIWKNASSG